MTIITRRWIRVDKLTLMFVNYQGKPLKTDNWAWALWQRLTKLIACSQLIE